MSAANIRNTIRSALDALLDKDFAVGAQDMLEILGYRSERTLHRQPGGMLTNSSGSFPLRSPVRRLSRRSANTPSPCVSCFR